MPDDPHFEFLARFILRLIIGVPLGAFTFQLTCGSFNKWLGRTPASRLPQPCFTDAAWISFLVLCAQGAVLYVVSLIALHAMTPYYPGELARYQSTVRLIELPLSLLASALIIGKKLPASFSRALILAVAFEVVHFMVLSILNLKSL